MVLARGGTPPGQGGIEILARGEWTSLRSCSSCSSSPSRTCSSRFSSLDRVLDIPVVPQKGDFTSAVLDQGCCRCCVRQLPIVQTVLQLHSPTRSSTSLVQNTGKCLRFSHRQSSMTILRRFWPIFRTPPKGVESRVARIFRALDDEEFFVVEGSPGWR